jgi:1,4-alpha-glucan branching enzyme
LYEKQFSPEGFEWISYSDHQNAVMSYIRKGEKEKENLVVVCNFTPVVREDYRVGLPKKGKITDFQYR